VLWEFHSILTSRFILGEEFFSKINKAVSLGTTVTLTGMQLFMLCVSYNVLPPVLVIAS
jgi:hypothetical protein